MNGRILINKNNLLNNFLEVKKFSPNAKIMSVIKSDAYGHGIIEAAKILKESDAYAVATIKEAKLLKENKINTEIVCLQGFSNTEEYIYCAKNNIRPVIHNFFQLDIIKNTQIKNSIKIWIKVDTGMNRLGFNESFTNEVLNTCSVIKEIQKPLGLMTHLANADEDADNFSSVQISRFKKICEDRDLELSIFNSAGIIKYSNHFNKYSNWVRPGLMLYGVNPCKNLNKIKLKPVMSLIAPIISIKDCKKGKSIGYGQSYIVKKDTRIAAVGIGYGDGLSRQLSNIGKVYFENNYYNIVGRISMDITMIDIDDCEIEIGSNVEIWGPNINIESVSNSINTIPYELMCNLGNRLDKEYV